MPGRVSISLQIPKRDLIREDHWQAMPSVIAKKTTKRAARTRHARALAVLIPGWDSLFSCEASTSAGTERFDQASSQES